MQSSTGRAEQKHAARTSCAAAMLAGLRGGSCCVAAFALAAPPGTAVAYVTDQEAHVVLNAKGQSVSAQAQQWLRNYAPAVDSEWNLVPTRQPSPTPVAAQAAEDLKTFKRVRTFQHFLWKDMLSGALLPDDSRRPPRRTGTRSRAGRAAASPSKSHWDLPLKLDGGGECTSS